MFRCGFRVCEGTLTFSFGEPMNEAGGESSANVDRNVTDSQIIEAVRAKRHRSIVIWRAFLLTCSKTCRSRCISLVPKMIQTSGVVGKCGRWVNCGVLAHDSGTGACSKGVICGVLPEGASNEVSIVAVHMKTGMVLVSGIQRRSQ